MLPIFISNNRCTLCSTISHGVGEVDFAFINPKDFDDIDIDVIYHDYMLAVLPVGHRLCKKASVHLKDLCDDPFILLDEGKNSVPLDAFHQYDLQIFQLKQ